MKVKINITCNNGTKNMKKLRDKLNEMKFLH